MFALYRNDQKKNLARSSVLENLKTLFVGQLFSQKNGQKMLFSCVNMVFPQ